MLLFLHLVQKSQNCCDKLRRIRPVQADVKVTTSLAGGEVWKGEVKLENTSDVPALMLRVKLAGKDGSLILPVMYSDNYFFLMPGESRTVSVEFNDFDLAGRTPQIEVSGFNVK